MQETEPTSTEFMEKPYGSYRVTRPLGVGGMSSVYHAVHVESGHEVALKVLPARMANKEIVLQRFLREARTAESLEHPNIVAIFDRGVDQGRYYLVLEYVDGCDLHEYVQSRGPLSASEALSVTRQVAEGLKFASARGLIHRDIKPSNILRSKKGEIKITDLGLALHTQFEDERVTREGTTVGTVDYMAPEQARDSRAASSLSDMYSLGCTLYYLLTGIPPYPGGDITDKLTRHARSAAPDVRDLRPDVPEGLARIMLRMMAKNPEDRFTSFDELIGALDGVQARDGGESPGVLLMPLDTPESVASQASNGRGARAIANGQPSRPPSSIPEISLANLPPEPAADQPISTFTRPLGREQEPVVLPRLGAMQAPLPRPGETGGAGPGQVQQSSLSTTAWISLSIALGTAFILMVIVIDRLVRTVPARSVVESVVAESPEVEPVEPAPEIADGVNRPVPASPKHEDQPSHQLHQEVAKPVPPPLVLPVEPADVDVQEPVTAYSEATLRKYLPDWALTPVAARVESPLIQVRRVSKSREPTLFSSLRPALNETRGTVEIADEGPFAINDFRIPGESRVIRARPGFHPIIRIDRPNLEAVWSLPGVIVLQEGKSLVLDSLDIIVNVRDLIARQTSFFSCTGANLTVRNCTITLINAANQPFTLVRAEGTPTRGSRIRLERTLIRGAVSAGFELGKGSIDLVVRETVFLGSQGPLVRRIGAEPTGEQRFSIVGGVLAARGPVVELRQPPGADPRRQTRPLVIRAFDSVFGRFQGAGIASVVFAETSATSPQEQVDWSGQQNLFCGWRGYYASGAEQTLRVPSLASFRSTWNGTDQNSREILSAWPQPQHLGQFVPADLAPFVPGREKALVQAAAPRPYLGQKTLWAFPTPLVAALVEPSVKPVAAAPTTLRKAQPHALVDNPSAPTGPAKVGRQNDPGQVKAGQLEIVFDADAAPWNGDLGAFLRDRLTAEVKHARVIVHGTGQRRTTPVRLHDGLILEIRVQPPSNGSSESISWQAAAESHAPALLELHGGALLLSHVRLRADESAAVDSLVHVQDGDLIVHGCQLLAPAGTEFRTSRLVSFSATGTRPRPSSLHHGLLTPEPDRPICLLEQSTLIAAGSVLQATVGKGLVAVNQSALAAGENVIELLPAEVARSRFDADLVLDHCTLASEANILRLGPWPGREPGPDRPWLVTSLNCAFLGGYERRLSTVLLRVDENAMARGTLFWQGNGDAVEVDAFTAAVDEPLSNRQRDVGFQWVSLWGSNHQTEITGPRATSNVPSVRLWERLKPGRVEPSDLILDPNHHLGRAQLDVGADLSLQGINPRSMAAVRRRPLTPSPSVH